MSDTNGLPLKKVVIRQADYFKPEGGGSRRAVFGDVTSEIRGQRANELDAVGEHFSAAFKAYPKAAAVARVVLKDEALAKSHRPTHLFQAADCPIVGVGGFGELLVSVRSSTLPKLRSAVMNGTTHDLIANISTIKAVEPFELPEPRLEHLADELGVEHDIPLKLRLFRHGVSVIDEALEEALRVQLAGLKVRVEPLRYGGGLVIFKLSGVRPRDVTSLGRFLGTQSLGAFPEFHVVRPAAQPVGKLTAAVFPPPDGDREYPIVGMVDTGVAPDHALLAPWVVGREEFVPKAARDYEHGTFVAGLIVHARALNHDDAQFPRASCKVLDVVAIPANGKIREDELLAILQEVVPRHPEIRVWNASLGGGEPCTDHAFSDMAIALDELQAQHRVTFVLASGNYSKPPFRGWPADVSGGEDRICGPADSTRALTVGSVAHRDSAASRVPARAPSPFSRRGPGPAHLPKPELVHFGGNCDAAGRHAQMGVLSVDAGGNLAEGIGTSFAAPIVAALLAHVQAAPTEPLSNAMAKALLIHSAALADGSLSAADLPYRGFGVPADLGAIMSCDPWRATLLFEIEIGAGIDLQRAPFPLPTCLRGSDGAFRGEMVATLVCEPPLDSTFGAEYCRSNVNVSIGTYGDTGQARQVHPYPARAEISADEQTLVEHGFKWSPVKVYRRQMPRGVMEPTWRLMVDATGRSGGTNEVVQAALVVTIADLERKAQVYNDVVAEMNRLGWATADVQLRQRMQPR